MKKGLIFSLLFALILTNLIIIPSITAQGVPALPGLSGEMDESGLPKEFSEFQEKADKLSEEEERKEYLQQEWTKLMANKKVVGPFLFYTNKFFRFFNPFWKIVFGTEFTWSWAFFFSLGIYIFLVNFLYKPSKAFLKLNPLMVLIASLIITTLIGVSGGIQSIVKMLSLFISGWFVSLIVLLIGAGIGFIYSKLIKKYGKKYKEKQAKYQEEIDRTTLHAEADVTREKFKDIKDNPFEAHSSDTSEF